MHLAGLDLGWSGLTRRSAPGQRSHLHIQAACFEMKLKSGSRHCQLLHGAQCWQGMADTRTYPRQERSRWHDSTTQVSASHATKQWQVGHCPVPAGQPKCLSPVPQPPPGFGVWQHQESTCPNRHAIGCSCGEEPNPAPHRPRSEQTPGLKERLRNRLMVWRFWEPGAQSAPACAIPFRVPLCCPLSSP